MSDSSSTILTPFDIGDVTLRNRLAVAPMTRVSAAETGHATSRMAHYYERFAKGGFGLVVSEGIYTDKAYAQGYPFQPGITDEVQAQAWRDVTDRIHAHQGVAFAQLMHAGALSQGNRFMNSTAAPSAIRPKGEQIDFYYGEGPFPVPKAMSEEDIADAIAGFAQAAKLASGSAGFDGIEIHGANGYLLDQFLTDYTNQRDDRWGGNTQNRMGLILEVIKAVRKEAGTLPVGIRISQGKVNDFAHKWGGGEKDAEIIFGSLHDAAVDFIHITEHKAWKPAFSSSDSSLVELARQYAPGAALIANGSLHEGTRAETAFCDGADIIALGKSALANPDFPHRLINHDSLAEFDASLLGPIADIKDIELAPM